MHIHQHPTRMCSLRYDYCITTWNNITAFGMKCGEHPTSKPIWLMNELCLGMCGTNTHSHSFIDPSPQTLPNEAEHFWYSVNPGNLIWLLYEQSTCRNEGAMTEKRRGRVRQLGEGWWKLWGLREEVVGVQEGSESWPKFCLEVCPSPIFLAFPFLKTHAHLSG